MELIRSLSSQELYIKKELHCGVVGALNDICDIRVECLTAYVLSDPITLGFSLLLAILFLFNLPSMNLQRIQREVDHVSRKATNRAIGIEVGMIIY